MKRNAFYPFMFSIVLVIGVLLGFVIRGRSHQKTSFAYRVGTDKVDEILNYIRYRYVDTVDIDKIYQDAIDEIFNDLDPHSAYIPANILRDVNESLRGDFEGIGIEFNILDDTIIVVSTLKGGPSEALGILSGDKIININDSLVAGRKISNADVVRLLKGPKNSAVLVGIQRFTSDTLIHYNIIRDRVEVSSILAHYMVDDSIAYIRISQFGGNTANEFHDALEDLDTLGMKKLIIDLRDNGGGYLDAATDIADELLNDDKLIVYTEGRSYPRKNFYAKRKGLFESGDLVLLVNEGTASASEILSGAVQDWGRGEIIGRRTYGKGLVQDQILLHDSSAMRLTIARYYTPNGRCIQRPYNKGVDEYNKDYMERLIGIYQTHDTTNIDTISWGIEPDIKLRADTLEVLGMIRELNNRGIIQQYAYRFYGMHTDAYGRYLSPGDFDWRYQMKDQVYQGFISFNKYTHSPVSKKELIKYEKEFRLALKGFIARQIFYTNGYYYFFNQLDPEYNAAVSYLKSK